MFLLLLAHHAIAGSGAMGPGMDDTPKTTDHTPASTAALSAPVVAQPTPQPAKPSFTITIMPTNLGSGGDLVCTAYSGITSYAFWLEVTAAPTKFNVRGNETAASVQINNPSVHMNDAHVDMIRPEASGRPGQTPPPKDMAGVMLTCEASLNEQFTATRIYFGDEVTGSGLSCTYNAGLKYPLECTPVK